MKIDLVGGTSQSWSLAFNAERTVNMFPVFDRKARENAALFSTPGLNLFSTAGVGGTRECFKSAKNGRVFFVSDSRLFEIDEAGTATSRGNLLQSSGNVTIEENETQMGICDGTDVYIFTYATNNFAVVSTAAWTAAGTITSVDSYFIINEVGTGKYYISALGDGTTWSSTDFASAESNPDAILRVFNGFGELYLFGSRSMEIHRNTGASNFPFERISGGTTDIGTSSPYTIISVGRAIFWVGQDKYGNGMVFSTTGISPKKISTEAIDLKLQSATSIEDLKAWSYQEHGHVFYVITGGGLSTSLVYDVTTEEWHERAYTNADGNFEQHRGQCCVFAFGKHLVGDRENGSIYEMSQDYYDDNGDAIIRERIYKHIFAEGDRVTYSELEIGAETGVGNTTGDYQDPIISLSLSKDSGRTFIEAGTDTLGTKGQYNKTVRFRRLGISETMTFRLRISAAVKVALFGSHLNATRGK